MSAQVTTRSPLGAVIHETGGILVDHGWLRILGSGSVRLDRAIHTWNLGRSFHEGGRVHPFYLVADDAAGGFFAMNGGAFGSDLGHIYYHPPDTLKWEPLEMLYSAFLQWSFGRHFRKWAAALRWPGWRQEVEALSGDDAILFYPFLFTEEGSPATSSRRAVPVSELYDQYVGGYEQADS